MVSQTMQRALLPKRIVVGLDELGLADSVVQAALLLSDALGAKLELIHAVPSTPRYWPGLAATASMDRSGQLFRSAREAALVHVRKILKRAPECKEQPEQIVRVVEGRPAEVLLAETRTPTDLVMLGARRPTEALHFGGTLRSLLAKSTGPVWVQSHDVAKFRRILVPIDMSAHSLNALGMAVALAGKLGARVHVLHAFQITYPIASTWPEVALWTPALSVDEMCAAAQSMFTDTLADFDWQGVEHEETFVEGEPTRVILDQAPAHDLLVISTHGHSGFAAAVLGSVAWKVVERCEGPILVTRLSGRPFSA